MQKRIISREPFLQIKTIEMFGATAARSAFFVREKIKPKLYPLSALPYRFPRILEQVFLIVLTSSPLIFFLKRGSIAD